MLPILIIAYRYGTKWGLFTAFAASLLQMLMGLNSFSYVTSTRALIAVAVFDFLLAFMAMGLGGVFRKVISSQSGALAARRGAGLLHPVSLPYGCGRHRVGGHLHPGP